MELRASEGEREGSKCEVRVKRVERSIEDKVDRDRTVESKEDSVRRAATPRGN